MNSVCDSCDTHACSVHSIDFDAEELGELYFYVFITTSVSLPLYVDY